MAFALTERHPRSVLTYQIRSFIEERGLKRIDKTFVVLGMVIAGFLTWYADYSNSHTGSANLGWFTYVALCPSSIFLMLTENAKAKWEQALIIAAVVVSNGALYGVVCLTVRELIQRRPST